MLKTIAIFASLSTLGFSAIPLKIETQISSHTVTIYEFKKPTIISEKFDANDILNSELIFKIEGMMEGNFCSFDGPVIQINYNHNLSNYPNEAYDIKFMSMKKPSPTINLTSGACLTFSRNTPFETKLKIQAMDQGGEDSKTWIYRFESRSASNKELTITLSYKTGWTWKFRSIY